MSRWKAATLHFSISVLAGVLITSFTFFICYPAPYFHAAGANELVLLLIGVDICVGPLLTLIVFRPGKWGLKFDLAFIAVAQLIAFVYGFTVLLQSRPIFLVGVVDRFAVVSANEISDADLAAATQPEFRTRSWTGPKLVSVEMPTNEKELSDLAFSALAGRDAQNLPKYYRSFEPTGKVLLKRARSLDKLETTSNNREIIDSELRRLSRSINDVRWIPLEARKRDMVMLIDSTTAMPLAAIPIDPW